MSKRKYGCRQSSVTQAETHKNADAEMNAAPGVEKKFPAQQFWGLPPELKKSKRKQGREQLNKKQETRGRKRTKKKDNTHQ